MLECKILTSRSVIEMEKKINELLSQGYQFQDNLTTYDCWEYEGPDWKTKTVGHRIQVTYFKQVMIKNK